MILVILDHAGLSLLSGGYIGVDVFFVLSGFLITGILVREYEKSQTISLAGFYARRVRRILPAGSVVLVATVIASALIFGGSRAGRVAEDARWATLFVSNFRFIELGTNYWDNTLPPSPLEHYWSLAVEEQFYFVWPACIIALTLFAKAIPLRTKLSVMLVATIVASLAWSVYQTAQNGTAAYFSPFPRAWELAAGALLAVATPWIRRWPRQLGVAMSLLGVAAIAAASLLFDAYTQFPGFAVVLPVGGAALAVAGGTAAPGQGVEWLLRCAPVQWIGKLSYSLYLWHWPVLIIAQGYVGHNLTLAENLLLCLGALALSALTFRLVESPARNSTWLKGRSPLISIAAGACLVLFSFGLATGLKATALEQSPVEESANIPSTSVYELPKGVVAS